MAKNSINKKSFEPDHARSIELEEILSRQLDENAKVKIQTIVNNVVFGSQRTERTDAEKAIQMEKSREEVGELIDDQNKKTDEQVVSEILVQIKTLGILKNDAPRFVEQLTEYAKLMNKLYSKR